MDKNKSFIIVKAKEEHIAPIAENMRKVDIEEIWAAARVSPHEAMIDGYWDSEHCWTGLYYDEPILMFGVHRTSVMGEFGVPWLLATEDASKIKRAFLLESRYYVDRMLETCPSLGNYVDVRNHASIRWLKWLGFELHDPMPYGKDGELFHPFTKRV